MEKIEIKCKGSKMLPLNKIVPFQDDLKFINESSLNKLKDSILKYGFTAPFFVWKGNILDGHQRLIALRELEEDGVELPEQFPIVEIVAESQREAKEKLLLFVSTYGKFNKKTSFFDDIPNLNMQPFELNFNFDSLNEDTDFGPLDDQFDDTGQVDEQEDTSTTTFLKTCPKCGHQFE